MVITELHPYRIHLYLRQSNVHVFILIWDGSPRWFLWDANSWIQHHMNSVIDLPCLIYYNHICPHVTPTELEIWPYDYQGNLSRAAGNARYQKVFLNSTRAAIWGSNQCNHICKYSNHHVPSGKKGKPHSSVSCGKRLETIVFVIPLSCMYISTSYNFRIMNLMEIDSSNFSTGQT